MEKDYTEVKVPERMQLDMGETAKTNAPWEGKKGGGSKKRECCPPGPPKIPYITTRGTLGRGGEEKTRNQKGCASASMKGGGNEELTKTKGEKKKRKDSDNASPGK